MKKTIFLILVLVPMLFLEAARPDTNPENLPSKSYSELPDHKTKMDFCIKQMTNGKIHRGMKLEKIVEIFGDDLRVPERFSKGRKFCFLYFEKQPENNDPLVSAGFMGWYACFEVAENCKLVNYWLSNLHK